MGLRVTLPPDSATPEELWSALYDLADEVERLRERAGTTDWRGEYGLRPTEARLAECLIRNAGRMVPAYTLLHELSDRGQAGQRPAYTLAVHIWRLRHDRERFVEDFEIVTHCGGVVYRQGRRETGPGAALDGYSLHRRASNTEAAA